MPFRFIYYYNAIVKPQPIFTFTKNNELNFSGNFDFWNKRIIWIFGREEDDNFKWFNSKNIKDMLTVEKNVDLVRKGLEIKFKKTPSFAIWNDFYADKTWLVYSETWMINYRESEIFKWSYNFLKEFPPGHHKLHLVFFARNNDYDADLTFRANMVYWFWDWWRWAYWTLQGVSDEELNLDSRAFWLSPDIKPDNYNIYYYVVVYDFYVPEISNISWTDKVYWGLRPVIKWSWASAWSELIFYSWYSKKISLDKIPPSYTSLVGYSPRLNWLPENLPVFDWDGGRSLLSVTAKSTPLTHKIKAWNNWQFSFKSIINLTYLEWETLDVIKNHSILKNYLTEDEQSVYKISAQYLDDKWNLIWAIPIKFSLQSTSSKILFHHHLNKNWEFETDSVIPIIAWSYLWDKLIKVKHGEISSFVRTNENWDFKIPIKLWQIWESTNIRFYSYGNESKLLWTLKILKKVKDYPEIISPISWEQFYSRYIPIQCNWKANSTVYFKLWIENSSEESEFQANIDSSWKCFLVSPRLLYPDENSASGAVYFLSASYNQDQSNSVRESFKMRKATKLYQINESDKYLTPNSLANPWDDIKLTSNNKVEFQFSKFRNKWFINDFSSLSIFNAKDEISFSKWISVLMSPLSMIEIKKDNVVAVLSQWSTVVHKDTWMENVIFNSWIYYFNWKYLSSWDIIKAPKAWTIVDFINNDEMTIKTFQKISFLAMMENENWSYVKTDKNIQYSFWTSELEISGLCDSVIKPFIEKYEFDNEVTPWTKSNITRDQCLLYSQLSTDKNKSPWLIYPQSNFRIKSWEKLRIIWYAWPWSTVKISINRKILWTVISNEDWYFDFQSWLSLPEVDYAFPSTIYLEDFDQTFATPNKTLIYIVPKDYWEFDEFSEDYLPQEYQDKNNNAFFDLKGIFNTSFFNKKK